MKVAGARFPCYNSFDALPGTVRISLANNNASDYVELARRLFELLDEYHAEYQDALSKN
ncbi:MAG: hypothetical protein K6G52_04170 [Treponemataceae bacterium]|nr:hypothetical protein [Treponemataceae bacterium]